MTVDVQTAPTTPSSPPALKNRPYRILLVDDESGIRKSLAAYLEHHGFEVDSAEDAIVAKELFAANRQDLVLTDISMPRVSGLDLLLQLKEMESSVEVIMITAYLDISFAIQAMRRGAYDFFTKPFNFEKILLTIERARERQQLKRQAEELANLKKQREFEAKAAMQTAVALARAIEERDKFNIGHGRRTAAFARALGEKLQLPESQLSQIHDAALLHDVGKIAIDDAILNKPGKLTEEEFTSIRRHPEIGDYMLRPMAFLAENIRLAVRHHHERWDGSGYPDGLRSVDIPVEARILCVADYFDSITSKRPYRLPMPVPEAIDLLRAERGRIFDPDLVDLFIEVIRDRLGDGVSAGE